jgi:hypothetical protein
MVADADDPCCYARPPYGTNSASAIRRRSNAPRTTSPPPADPQLIEPLARLPFRGVEDTSLAGLNRQAFATTAANLFSTVNEIHAFREGNGRAQRMLLTAIAKAARHPVAFDVITRERMVATSIAAAAGDTSGFARIFEEITDPRRVEALRHGLHAMRRFGIAGGNDLYVATT